MKPVVYILRSLKTKQYYVGSALNFERRFQEHSSGQVRATKYILPLELVFKQEFATAKEARQIEYRLKRKKSRVIIEKIIAEGKIGFAE
jgi:predicted GIY-YIG superfamily endonuclease